MPSMKSTNTSHVQLNHQEESVEAFGWESAFYLPTFRNQTDASSIYILHLFG